METIKIFFDISHMKQNPVIITDVWCYGCSVQNKNICTTRLTKLVGSMMIKTKLAQRFNMGIPLGQQGYSTLDQQWYPTGSTRVFHPGSTMVFHWVNKLDWATLGYSTPVNKGIPPEATRVFHPGSTRVFHPGQQGYSSLGNIRVFHPGQQGYSSRGNKGIPPWVTRVFLDHFMHTTNRMQHIKVL